MKKSKAEAIIDVLTAISCSPSIVSKFRQNPKSVFKPIPNLTKNEMERLANGDKVVINKIISGRVLPINTPMKLVDTIVQDPNRVDEVKRQINEAVAWSKSLIGYNPTKVQNRQ